MRRIVFLLLITSLLLSCQRNIQGIWISTYYEDENERIKPVFPKRIIEFTNDSVYIKEYGISTSGHYSLKRDQLIIDDSIENKIIKIKADSIVFEDLQRNKIIFKRLNESYKNKSNKAINLIGKSFKFESEQWSDTLTFVDESTLTNRKYDGINRNWQLLSYRGYNIMMIDDAFDFPLIIRGIKDKEIDITILYTHPIDAKLIELDNID